MKVFLLYKVLRKVTHYFTNTIDRFRCIIVFWGNNVQYHNFQSSGVPFVSVAIGGSFSIGENLSMNNSISGNPIGCFNPCTLFVDKGAQLVIGSNLGISQAAIVCHTSINIGNNVKIGGGVCIYDTDFHSLDPLVRANPKADFVNKIKKPVIIGNNVFIGAHSLILKGVTIGENAIIGAGSVVTKSIPKNEIWAGNPAKFIRNI